ncbi:MAG: DUF3592 domain-containing protein [Alphaproteobacteria bacterium]|nr:MAG: DUF3592 domain-containing protein [Alphaproteobacteria bacterium]
MFEGIFDSAIAYQQVLMLIGGFIALGLGTLLAGNEIYSRRRALRVAGIISGVRQKGNTYYPVYRYQLPGGEVFDSTSDIGSSAFQGKETGRLVPLLVDPDAPAAARAAGNWAFGAVGVFLASAGGLLILFAFLEYPVTQMTWIVTVALFCYSGMKLQNILVPKGQRLTLAAWKAAMKQKHDAEMLGLPVVRIEDLMAADSGKKALAQKQRARLVAGPLIFGCGMLLMVAGVHFGNGLDSMLQQGATAQGTVVAVEGAENAAPGGLAYPVVSFTDDKGRSVRFRDKRGRFPPEFGVGEDVSVLYLPGDAAHIAMIDRGAGDYLLPLFLLLSGTVFSIAGAVMMRRDQKNLKKGG